MRGEGRKCFTGRSGVLLINLYCAGFRLKDGRKKGTQKKKKKKKEKKDRSRYDLRVLTVKIEKRFSYE